MHGIELELLPIVISEYPNIPMVILALQSWSSLSLFFRVCIFVWVYHGNYHISNLKFWEFSNLGFSSVQSGRHTSDSSLFLGSRWAQEVTMLQLPFTRTRNMRDDTQERKERWFAGLCQEYQDIDDECMDLKSNVSHLWPLHVLIARDILLQSWSSFSTLRYHKSNVWIRWEYHFTPKFKFSSSIESTLWISPYARTLLFFRVEAIYEVVCSFPNTSG